jgi:putative FmdB family regulatory protein
MPTYDYRCKECGEVFEDFRHFSGLSKEVKCPDRGSETGQKIKPVRKF